jgi:hypothetical protein
MILTAVSEASISRLLGLFPAKSRALTAPYLTAVLKMQSGTMRSPDSIGTVRAAGCTTFGFVTV